MAFIHTVSGDAPNLGVVEQTTHRGDASVVVVGLRKHKLVGAGLPLLATPIVHLKDDNRASMLGRCVGALQPALLDDIHSFGSVVVAMRLYVTGIRGIPDYDTPLYRG